MATQRYISTSFWDDTWIQSLEPHQKMIYMYLLTNNLTNIAGVYEISKRRISFDTGYPLDRVSEALIRFEEDKKAYHFDDAWIILPNWPKHQKVTERSKIKDGIDAILKNVPDAVWSFICGIDYKYEFLSEIGREIYPIDTPCIPLTRNSNYSESDIESDIESNKDILSGKPDDESGIESELLDDEPKAKRGSIPYTDIIDYLNQTCGTGFKHTAESNKRHIRARWNEGYRLDDFHAVIDKKAREWQHSDMAKYLRPSTLFGAKFDEYLNQVEPIFRDKQKDSMADKLADTFAAIDFLERTKNEAGST